jgi:serine/threonine-protein kinase RsbW
MADRAKFTIPGKPAYLTMVRLAIGAIADMMGFDIEEIEDIKTAVSEACKNISCHGLSGFAEEYTVECVADDKYLEIYVTDNSSGHVLEKVAKPCLDCPNEGNLGIFVIQSLMNEVELIDNTQGKKTIKMVKRK